MKIISRHSYVTVTRAVRHRPGIAMQFAIFLLSALALSACEQSSLGELDAAELRENFPEAPVRDLAFAAATGDVREIRKIVESGVEVDSIGQDGRTPLMVAVQFNQAESVTTLLDLGADSNHFVRSNRNSPVKSAAGLADTVVLKILLNRGANPDCGKEWQDVPIVSRADVGDLEAVRVLVEAGADVNGRGLNDDTAIIAAARRAHYNVVLYLLEQGANYKLTNGADESLIQFIEEKFYRNLNSERDFRQDVAEILRARGETVTPYE